MKLIPETYCSNIIIVFWCTLYSGNMSGVQSVGLKLSMAQRSKYSWLATIW